jgi:hypothetical protein
MTEGLFLEGDKILLRLELVLGTYFFFYSTFIILMIQKFQRSSSEGCQTQHNIEKRSVPKDGWFPDLFYTLCF